jgi:hypothetical protein
MSRTPLEAAELKEHNRNELSRGWEIKVLGPNAWALSRPSATLPRAKGGGGLLGIIALARLLTLSYAHISLDDAARV